MPCAGNKLLEYQFNIQIYLILSITVSNMNSRLEDKDN